MSWCIFGEGGKNLSTFFAPCLCLSLTELNILQPFLLGKSHTLVWVFFCECNWYPPPPPEYLALHMYQISIYKVFVCKYTYVCICMHIYISARIYPGRILRYKLLGISPKAKAVCHWLVVWGLLPGTCKNRLGGLGPVQSYLYISLCNLETSIFLSAFGSSREKRNLKC